MARVSLLITWLVIFGPATTAFAGQPYQALDAGDVFVATITRVEDLGATNAQPPRVWLEVHEVLRGNAKVDRSPALWSPPFHGIDFVDENTPGMLKRWNAAPLKGPKVGEKFILGGPALEKPVGNGKNVKDNDVKYQLFAFVRIPFSDKARQQTIDGLKALDESRRKYAAEQVVAAKERASRAQAWRAALDAKTIDRSTQQADAVAIGKIVSGSTFEIERMIKGQPRLSSGGKYYVSLPQDGFDKRIMDLVMDDRPRCVLFLSEKKLFASVTSVYANLVDPYEGIVIADTEAIKAVEASLTKRPAPKPRPVLVISTLGRDDASAIMSASRTIFEVVHSRQFSFHGTHSIKHVRDTIPQAACLVMIDHGPERHVQAVRIEKCSATTVYDATWPEHETQAHIDALLKALANKTRE